MEELIPAPRELNEIKYPAYAYELNDAGTIVVEVPDLYIRMEVIESIDTTLVLVQGVVSRILINRVSDGRPIALPSKHADIEGGLYVSPSPEVTRVLLRVDESDIANVRTSACTIMNLNSFREKLYSQWVLSLLDNALVEAARKTFYEHHIELNSTILEALKVLYDNGHLRMPHCHQKKEEV